MDFTVGQIQGEKTLLSGINLLPINPQ